MKRIHHQTQPTASSCIATCLAMLINRDSSHVNDEFTKDYISGHIDVPVYLGRYGILCKPQLAAGIHQLTTGKLYLATVPSLQLAGMFHQVIIDTRDGEIKVLDPAKGFNKKVQYYTISSSELDSDSESYNNCAYPLRSFILDYEIVFVEDL